MMVNVMARSTYIEFRGGSCGGSCGCSCAGTCGDEGCADAVAFDCDCACGTCASGKGNNIDRGTQNVTPGPFCIRTFNDDDDDDATNASSTTFIIGDASSDPSTMPVPRP